MKLIAHRSGPSVYPEQTIFSAKHALQLGADIVEVDVRLTQDGKLAITHDLSLSRVFGIDRDIDQMTAEEFLTARHKDAPCFCSHLLEDYLKCGISPLLIHIKELRSPQLKAEVIRCLLQVIDEYDSADKIIIGVTDLASAEQVRAHNANIKILSFGSQESIPGFIAFRADYIRLWEAWLTPELVDPVKESSSELWVMSGHVKDGTTGIPTEEGLRKILSFAPDGLLINDISQAVKMLQQEH